MNVRLNYVVLIAALLVGPIAIAAALQPDATLASSVTALVAMVVVAVLLPQEWKRDRRAAAAFLLGVSVIVAAGAGTWAVGERGTQNLAVAIGIGALGSASWFALVVWREYSFRDLLPSWLDQTFPGVAMYEDDGVQWTIARAAAPDEAPEVQVHLQNNIEATRTVEVRLHDESGFAMRSGALLLPGTFAVELPPRAHASLTLPVRWHPNHSARKVRLFCFVKARGPAAPRNRRQRAHPGPRPTSKWIVVLGPIAGHITTRRGGVHLVLNRPAQPAPQRGALLGRVDLLERPVLVPARGAGLARGGSRG